MIDLHNPDWSGASLKIKDAKSLSPFEYGLEYGTPARGLWNIVHTGMLLPESHQIYICGQGCLRGVVLTAAEMNAMDRFSTVAVCENNVLDGDMEELIINGVSDVIEKLPVKPKVIEVFTSCIHHFMGCDLNFVYSQLRERWPAIRFTDCYMNPIMRKTKTPPDPMTRMRLYSFLEKTEIKNRKAVNVIGSNYRTRDESDLALLLKKAGVELREITRCSNFEEYMKLSESALNIGYMPASLPALKELQERLGTEFLYIPVSYEPEEIEAGLAALAKYLGLPAPDCTEERREAEAALAETAALLDGITVTIDYTATPRPLGLAELLLDRGFKVRTVYADQFIPEEEPAFRRLREKYPELELAATVHPKMGFLPRAVNTGREKIVAIGQKAAYFSNTPYFVNILEGGGFRGYDGWRNIALELREAFLNKKDTKKIIQVKGWGCCA